MSTCYSSNAEVVGIEHEFLTPAQISERWPLLRTEDLKGALFHPTDPMDEFNGSICYTPDGKPLVGPAPRLRNMWLAEGFSFGITAADVRDIARADDGECGAEIEGASAAG